MLVANKFNAFRGRMDVLALLCSIGEDGQDASDLVGYHNMDANATNDDSMTYLRLGEFSIVIVLALVSCFLMLNLTTIIKTFWIYLLTFVATIDFS